MSKRHCLLLEIVAVARDLRWRLFHLQSKLLENLHHGLGSVSELALIGLRFVVNEAPVQDVKAEGPRREFVLKLVAHRLQQHGNTQRVLLGESACVFYALFDRCGLIARRNNDANRPHVCSVRLADVNDEEAQTVRELVQRRVQQRHRGVERWSCD